MNTRVKNKFHFFYFVEGVEGAGDLMAEGWAAQGVGLDRQVFIFFSSAG